MSAAELLLAATLALWSFLGATVLPAGPFGADGMFVALLAGGFSAPLFLFLTVCLANSLGGATNWVVGRLLRNGSETPAVQRWLERVHLPAAQMQRVDDAFQRFGWVSLLFCWLPVVGDLIGVVAGIAQMRFWPFFVLQALGRCGRYAVLWAVTAGLFNV